MTIGRLAVGITGHRLNQLPPSAVPVVSAAIGYALTLVEASGRELADASARPVMVSAIAEGADRMAAIAALKMKWRLETPLPFAPERYEQDFADEASKAEFAALLKRSKRLAITTRANEPGAAPYAGVGSMIVEWSDVLLAVWNGLPPKGPGGTAEVAAKMIAKGSPVVWIPSDTGGPIQLVAPNDRADAPITAALARRLARIAQPEAMRAA